MGFDTGKRLSASGMLIGLTIALALSIAAPVSAQKSAETAEFASVRADVAQRWPGLRHVSADEFSQLMASGNPVLDVRSPAEFAVSRLPGAIQVDPSLSSSAFRKAFAGRIQGKMVLVYCSVGVRSSKLATAIANEVEAAGGAGVVNLSGGIFGWHNEARALVNADGPTDFVHAFSETWGRVLSRPGLIRTEPPSAAPH